MQKIVHFVFLIGNRLYVKKLKKVIKN